ncbi:hypothetical protein DERP_004179 [Dermatophagoides pteronyssinus]|uniref:Secreted peptide n=1 Tax=Dermatophagoides pteronyssinus TaxID=6956 RepID=A0ABQ8J8F0_DERPT|nr:hypothetical protein DERP_004179 [Dermatophagoides pteronyssinus]
MAMWWVGGWLVDDNGGGNDGDCNELPPFAPLPELPPNIKSAALAADDTDVITDGLPPFIIAAAAAAATAADTC